MTEDEAKTKWCPFARQAVWDEGGPTGGNRNMANDPNAESNCIASACMAWRWEPLAPRYEGTSMIVEYPAPPRTDGRCGLAGKP